MHTYIPQDRLRALAHGTPLPKRATGSALFADISGFTPLTEALRNAHGPRRGAEELTRYLEAVYTALIAEVERYGGSVIGFAGDAITCWFDSAHGPTAPRATACALALQSALRAFTTLTLPHATPHATASTTPNEARPTAAPPAGLGVSGALALKVAVATGTARRFMVGDPTLQRLDTLAGATIARMATAERSAHKGEIIVDEATASALGSALSIHAWRTDHETHARFAVVAHYTGTAETPAFPTPTDVPASLLQGWVHPPVYARELAGHGSFLTEFRPCVALFVRFSGIDYDTDAAETQLDAFIRHVQTLAARYAGTLMDVTIGDKGGYAYLNLGALSAHEDDGRRGVYIALALRDAARALGFLAPLQIGLAQGILRAGTYGGPTRRTYGALGDEVNLAARLMEAAAPGEILVTSRIYHAITHDFTFAPRRALTVKGKSKPITAFVVQGMQARRAIHLQEPTYSLPMVGRQAELQIITEKLAQTLQGKAQLIGIVGEAGLGKSRLTAEVVRHARQHGFIGYGGACQSDGVNTPYLAWKAIWSEFFGADPELPHAQQIHRVESQLAHYAPQRISALPLLDILLNLEIPDNDFTRTLAPPDRQHALHALLENCLRAATTGATGRTPLLIVIEDLHWLDASSQDLLEGLARALADQPICFLLAYRPPAVSGQRWATPRFETLPYYTKIELAELNAAEALQVLRAKLAQLYPADETDAQALPTPLVEKLLTRAQGNPFYLEELLNFLRDRGLDPRAPLALESIELPDSLHTLVLSRIDQLTEREKTTLRVASIIGRLFRASWLTGYYPELGTLPVVLTDLDQLAKLDITPLDALGQSSPNFPGTAPSGEPDPAYLFKHIVTHEVTYESMPFATRVRLHERLAQYLEMHIALGTLREAALLDTLVYHYQRAENPDKQRIYLRRAAQAALEASAFRTALEYQTRLLTLTPVTDPAHGTLTLQLAETYFYLGDFPNTRTAARQARAHTTEVTERIAALALEGEVEAVIGDYPAVEALLAEAVPLARASGDALALSHVLYVLGDTHLRQIRNAEASAALYESLALARAAGDVTRELFALNRLGMVVMNSDLAEAERIFMEVRQRAQAVGNRERLMVALNNLGFAAEWRQDYSAERAYLQQSSMLAHEIGAQRGIVISQVNLINAHLKLGQLADARASFHEALTTAARMDAGSILTWTVAHFADILIAEGQVERAVKLLGLARRQPLWNSYNQSQLEATLTQLALDPAVAEDWLAQGAALDWDATLQELLQE